jgi:hypothetical protein
LRRAPDLAGLAAWAFSDLDLRDVRLGIVASQEAYSQQA